MNTVEKIMKQKSDRLEKEIYELKSCSNSRSTRAFKLVEKIRGPKKSGPEAVAIQDPVTNEMKTSKNKNCNCFLTKAGQDFQAATKILLQRIWEFNLVVV